jgi:hypothetical protein
MPVRELLARTDARELGEWMAFYSLEIEDQAKAEMRAKAEAAVQNRRSQH